MGFDVFIALLMAISVFTGLFTEAIKKFLQERGNKYYPNALAGYVSIALSVITGIGYMIVIGASINAKMAICLISLMLLSWLGSMVGYDKVIQTITQLKDNKVN